jgi:hypothetical protein
MDVTTANGEEYFFGFDDFRAIWEESVKLSRYYYSRVGTEITPACIKRSKSRQESIAKKIDHITNVLENCLSYCGWLDIKLQEVVSCFEDTKRVAFENWPPKKVVEQEQA